MWYLLNQVLQGGKSVRAIFLSLDLFIVLNAKYHAREYSSTYFDIAN